MIGLVDIMMRTGFPYEFHLDFGPIEVKVLDERAKGFSQSTEYSAGYDLVACIDEPVVIKKDEKAVLIPTGLAIFARSPYIMGMIVPRSGLGHKQGLVMGNSVGIVDGDYQNQVYVSAWNRGQQDEITINPGDRIAQYIFVPVCQPNIVFVDKFSEVTERGLGGFGSTGVASK